MPILKYLLHCQNHILVMYILGKKKIANLPTLFLLKIVSGKTAFFFFGPDININIILYSIKKNRVEPV
jgi:hypothetical protein